MPVADHKVLNLSAIVVARGVIAELARMSCELK